MCELPVVRDVGKKHAYIGHDDVKNHLGSLFDLSDRGGLVQDHPVAI